MSKSYRHTPILKDGGKSSKNNKRLANRNIRRRLNRDLHDDSSSRIYPKKMYESWNINDYVERYTREQAIQRYNDKLGHGYFSYLFYEKYPTLEDWLKDWEKDFVRK